MTVLRTRLPLRVSPGARRSAVVGRLGDRWKVRVAAPPEDGRANEALTRYLSELLDVPTAGVRVVSGGGGREKVVEVDGRAAPEVEALLAAAAERDS